MTGREFADDLLDMQLWQLLLLWLAVRCAWAFFGGLGAGVYQVLRDRRAR